MPDILVNGRHVEPFYAMYNGDHLELGFREPTTGKRVTLELSLSQFPPVSPRHPGAGAGAGNDVRRAATGASDGQHAQGEVSEAAAREEAEAAARRAEANPNAAAAQQQRDPDQTGGGFVSLSTDPARALTSREIAKIVSGVFGSLAGWSDPDELAAALDHFIEHRDRYVDEWRRVHKAIAELERRQGAGVAGVVRSPL